MELDVYPRGSSIVAIPVHNNAAHFLLMAQGGAFPKHPIVGACELLFEIQIANIAELGFAIIQGAV